MRIYPYKIGLFFLIFTLPLEVVSYYAGFTIKLWMLIFAAGIFFWLIQIIRGKTVIQVNPVIFLFVLLLMANMVSLLNVGDVGRWLRMTIQYIILFSLTLYVINTVNTERKIEFSVRSLIVTGIVLGIYGLIQWIGAAYGYDLSLPIEKYPLYGPDMNSSLRLWTVQIGDIWVPRSRGTFGDPTIYGGYMLSIAPLIISVTVYNICKKKYVFVSLIATVIVVGATFGSFSRSIIGGFILSTLVILFYWKRIFNKVSILKKLFIIVIFLLIAFFILPSKISNLFNPSLYMGRVGQTFLKGDESTSHHKNLALEAVRIWKEHPVFGVGLGNYGVFVGEGAPANAMSHSAFLSFLSETGLVGCIINAFMVLYLVIITHKYLIKSPSRDIFFAYRVGLLAGYIGVIGSNFTYHYYNQPFLWFMIGIIILLNKHANLTGSI
ncbi:MAG: O-Antigen ligase [Elusimicrobia bacterium ADurb.Bin231]|nr:MAG: O-Antigen ligase [Elusimicrobia bacterium ADurb.Bin231]